jgi:SAM-dependent methyltransferase
MPYDTPYADPGLYDVIYSGVQDDIPFYVTLARAARGPTLEIGCGTGRILIPALQASADIDGLDLDAGMLAHLEKKARGLGHAPRLVHADMRDFTMPRRYALAIAPFRVFMHLITTEDQLRALRCVREHLEPGGAFVFNLFYPNFESMLAHDGRRRLSIEVVDPETGGRVEVYDVSRYDRVPQIVRVEREVVRADDAAAPVTRAGFHLRWTYRYEIELLLAAAGFPRWDLWGGYDRRPLEKDTDEMVVQAWKD